MSHHYSGPDWGFPHGDARLDLTDLYAFPKPGDAGKSILIVNVHPSVRDYLDGENPLGPTTAEPFATEALYELKIDTDGDAVADIAYRVRVSSSEGGGADRDAAPRRRRAGRRDWRWRAGYRRGGAGLDGSGGAGDAGRRVPLLRGLAQRSLFLRQAGALNNLQFTGDDYFADQDLCSIVLEVPNPALGPKEVGLWHRTLIPAEGPGGDWVQAERGARPLQLFLVLGLSDAERVAYLTGEPAYDVRFVAAFAHALEHTGGYTPEEARRVAGTMLPEILSYDPTRPASFPDNGRTLTDDTVDAFLAILTNGKVTEDGVGSHGDLLAEFPYLGPPHWRAAAWRTLSSSATATK
jgi:hypothetical protein